jgi:hypothetical protein
MGCFAVGKREISRRSACGGRVSRGLLPADNARARLKLNWRPRYASWADGFAAEPPHDKVTA